MKSFKQMIQSGEIKRADAMKVKYEDLHVEPGFNLRASIDALEGDDKLQALEDDASLYMHIKSGGIFPPLEVRPREEGGVWIVDGHRRHTAIGKAIEDGAPIEWVNVTAFVGNDVDRCARVLTSQENRKLRPLEVAAGYKRLAGFGLSPDDIATKVQKTRQHVEQMLILANAPHAVQQMVKAGTVSATEAMKITREHGENAAEVLDKAAKQTGGKKITAKALNPYALPAKVLRSVAEELDSFFETLPPQTKIEINAAANKPDNMHHIGVPSTLLLSLLAEHERMTTAKNKAAERQR